MWQRWILRLLNAFERKWRYSMDSWRHLLSLSPAALMDFRKAAVLAHQRRGVAPAPWFTAKIVAARGEDCGPCVQLSVDMALAAGVEAALLRAVLADDGEQLARLDPASHAAWAFGRAWAAGEPEATLAPLREAILAALGAQGMASVVLAMLGVRLFPQLKRALGHAEACQRIRVDGHDLMMAHDRRLV